MARIRLDDGVRYEVRAGGDGPPLLLLHGFAGRGAWWAPHLAAFRRVRRTIVVDLLGHGRSDAPEDPRRHAVERQAADLAAILERLDARHADVLGYSLGARIALRLAVDRPGIVGRLVLESPSAGIADSAARLRRRQADERWVQLLGRGDLHAFVDAWLAQPIFASRRGLAARLRERDRARYLDNRPAALAVSLTGAGQGVMEPVGPLLQRVGASTLVLAGELDAAGTRRAECVAAAIPDARLAIVSGAGHAPHLEAPVAFRRLVLGFLDPAIRDCLMPPRLDAGRRAPDAPRTRR